MLTGFFVIHTISLVACIVTPFTARAVSTSHLNPACGMLLHIDYRLCEGEGGRQDTWGVVSVRSANVMSGKY